MTIHAFSRGGDSTKCGLRFPSHMRVSSPQDMPAGHKATTCPTNVTCNACREKLGLQPTDETDIYTAEVRDNGYLAGRKFRFMENGSIVELGPDSEPLREPLKDNTGCDV